MKAITIWQPWASLIAIGTKRFETRSWATSYRGPIAIHAALRPAHELDRQTSEAIARAFKDYTAIEDLPSYIAGLPHGAIVATADLVDCHPIRRNSEDDAIYIRDSERMFEYWLSPTDSEYLFGNWLPGRYAWELANMQMLDAPIPAKGQQGLWNWEWEGERQC